MVPTEEGTVMNTYFNYTDPVEPGGRLESNKYNQDFSGIQRAFDLLPSPEALATNTGSYAESTGNGAAYQAILPRFDGSFGYLTGMQVLLKMHVTNTGPATLDINGIGARQLVNLTTGLGPLVAGDLTAGTIYSIRYDGTRFQVANTVATAIAQSQSAANSATASATAAAGSATAAANSATTASERASAAAGSATAAAGSATAAAGSATAAANSATTATTQAGNASASATAAAGSATAAAGSATNANASATAAAGSATAAGNSASAAAGSASAAAGSATSASNSAARAEATLTSATMRNVILNEMIGTSLRVGVIKLFATNLDPNVLYPGTTWVRLPANRALRTCAADGSDIMQEAGSDNITLSANNIPAHTHEAAVTISAFDYGTKTSTSTDLGDKDIAAFNYGSITTTAFDYGSITTSSFDHGTKTSDSAGAHTHNFTIYHLNTSDQRVLPGAGGPSVQGSGTFATNSNGAHSHTVAIGSHSHSVPVGSHSHNVAIGSHTHTVALGTHSHNVAIGSHTHTVAVTVNSTPAAVSFSILNAIVKVAAWRRTV